MLQKSRLSFLFAGLLLIGSAPVYLQCQEDMPHLKTTIKKRNLLPEIPSASGIACYQDSIYIIGDDSPWMFVLDSSYNLVRKVKLLGDTSNLQIVKEAKPDFEGLAIGPTLEGNKFFILGSGAKSPQRDKLIIGSVDSPDSFQTYNITKLNDHIRDICGLLPSELNLEGITVMGDKLVLLNRGKNLVLIFTLQDLLGYLREDKPAPLIEVIPMNLPAMNGMTAGFSGLDWIPETQSLLFTASVELTKNWIDDGPILGSYLGIMRFDQSYQKPMVYWDELKMFDEILPVKVESVCIKQIDKEGVIQILMVTDSDGGKSELLEADVVLNY